MTRTPIDINAGADNAGRAVDKDESKGTEDASLSKLKDLYELASKIQYTIRQIQQSVLLLMVFGMAVWCMMYADLLHMEVLMLFTVCSYILLRWGLPKS